ncbi:hypothetical protein FBQ97_00935 [Acidobacteria bacterium ACD]|nr:hypothetical protein [Acidobacteria bacterium ACD]
MRSGARPCRGLTLVEVAVVTLVTVLVLLAAQQMLVSLFGEGKRTGTEALTPQSLPFLLDRVHRDLLSAGGASVTPEPGKAGAWRVELSPAVAGDPRVVYVFRRETVKRSLVSGKKGEKRTTREWKVRGSLELVEEELAYGRLSFFYEPPSGEVELLAFPLPRGEAGGGP